MLRTNNQFLLALGRLEKVEYLKTTGEAKKCAVSLISIGAARINVIIPLEGLVDFAEEIKRIQKEIERNKKDLDLTQGKLSSENFMKNAPDEIKNQEKERLSQLQDKSKQLLLSLDRLS